MMAEKKIRCVVVPVEGEPRIEVIPNELEAFQKIVGGYIETVKLDAVTALVCNEEGKIEGLPITARLMNPDGSLCDYIMGDFLLCRTAGEEFASIPETGAIQMREYLCEKPRMIFLKD